MDRRDFVKIGLAGLAAAMSSSSLIAQTAQISDPVEEVLNGSIKYHPPTPEFINNLCAQLETEYKNRTNFVNSYSSVVSGRIRETREWKSREASSEWNGFADNYIYYCMNNLGELKPTVMALRLATYYYSTPFSPTPAWCDFVRTNKPYLEEIFSSIRFEEMSREVATIYKPPLVSTTHNWALRSVCKYKNAVSSPNSI